jgi:hypothetical protein
VLFDYYHACEFTGIDNSCFYGDYVVFGSYTVNSEILFQMWFLMLLWFLPQIVLKNSIANWCRDKSSLSVADVVWVWVPNRDEGTKNVVRRGAWARITRGVSCGVGTRHDGPILIVTYTVPNLSPAGVCDAPRAHGPLPARALRPPLTDLRGPRQVSAIARASHCASL